MVAGPAPARLDLVADEQPAVAPDDADRDLEVLLRRHDEPAGALNRLGDERGRPARGLGADQLFQALRAFHPARGILEAQRAAIAVRGEAVLDARHLRGHDPPRLLAGDRERSEAAAGIAVA